jgi:hypothetical protein
VLGDSGFGHVKKNLFVQAERTPCLCTGNMLLATALPFFDKPSRCRRNLMKNINILVVASQQQGGKQGIGQPVRRQTPSYAQSYPQPGMK